MQYYDHALMGATLALATGTYRRQGWGIVAMAAAAGSLPDWDAVPYPAGTPYYSAVHRVWGHNLLVAPLLSAAVGALGYLCWLSARRSTETPRQEFSASAFAVWVVVGVLASLSHLLADVFYCGELKNPDWPVRLFWPFSWRGLAVPAVIWADRFVTWVLAGTLVAAGLRPAIAQVLAVGALLTVAGYVTLHGLLLL